MYVHNEMNAARNEPAQETEKFEMRTVEGLA